MTEFKRTFHYPEPAPVVAPVRESVRRRWEYLTVNSQRTNENELGRAGWELVSVCLRTDGVTTLYFKRPLQPTPDASP